MLIRALIRHDNDRLSSENTPLSMIVRKVGRVFSLGREEETKLPLLLILEFKACDVPEGFNNSIPMFFVLKGLIIYFKGKYCRRLFSAQLSILFLS